MRQHELSGQIRLDADLELGGQVEVVDVLVAGTAGDSSAAALLEGQHYGVGGGDLVGECNGGGGGSGDGNGSCEGDGDSIGDDEEEQNT